MIRPQARTTRSAATVLLVDDDGDCRQLVHEAVLAGHPGYDVREVADGPQAMAYLCRQGRFAAALRPDLICLDVEMPLTSGLDVLRAIKAAPALADIPVLMITGLGDEEHRAAAERDGAAGYAVKPTDPREFIRVVGEAIDRCMSHTPPDKQYA